MTVTAQARTLLRDLACRVAEIAALPVMAERKALTCKRRPERFTQWTAIARELVETR